MRCTLTAVLVLALLLAQGLGALHRIEHAQGPATQGHEGHAQHTHHLLEELFSQHGDEQDCRLFDQLTQADAPGFAIPALSTQPPADVLVVVRDMPLRVRRNAHPLARGPPSAG